MKFEKPCEVLGKKLKEKGIEKPKLLIHPGRGNFLNRLAYKVFKEEVSVVPKESFPEEIKPGRIIREVEGVKFLYSKGKEQPDAAVVKGKKEGRVIFSEVELNYPVIGVDFSLFNLLSEKEKKSLAVQVEIAFGTVKDYFTSENFLVTSLSKEGEEFLNKFFHPHFPFKKGDVSEFKKVIVLDPLGEKEFTHEEVDSDTLILVGGIVDSSERLKGSTSKLFPHFIHRKITYKGEVSIVPDRINEIVKIVCQYLTEKITLWEAVERNLTRDSKLRWLRQKLQDSIVRFVRKGKSFKGISEATYKEWQKEFGISEFLWRRAALHVGGFVVFKDSLLSKVKREVRKRGKTFLEVMEVEDGEIVKKYP